MVNISFSYFHYNGIKWAWSITGGRGLLIMGVQRSRLLSIFLVHLIQGKYSFINKNKLITFKNLHYKFIVSCFAREME